MTILDLPYPSTETADSKNSASGMRRGPAPGGNKSPNSNNGLSVVRPSSAFHALRRAAHSSILIVAAIPCLYTFCTNSGMFASPEGNSQVPKI
jgi:hypothetical protein